MFGAGGGQMVSEVLSEKLEYEVQLLGKIPFDPRLREGGDTGQPLVVSTPEAEASIALEEIAQKIASRPRGLAGMNLGISPN
jgi:ATP-binding protein involved in chromosome partitioning